MKNSPEISDSEFDILLNNLKELEAHYPELIKPDSPTQRVGGAVAEGFKSVTHRVPMMSIDNISDAEGAYEFDKRVKKLVDGGRERYRVCSRAQVRRRLGLAYL